MIPIALADNCPLIGRALSALFARSKAYLLIWHARTDRELFHCLSQVRPQVLILDPALAGDGASLHLVQKLHLLHKRLPILIYTATFHRDFPASCMQLGAVGFVSKDSPEDELLMAVQRLADGHLYLNPVLTEDVLRAHISDKGNAHTPSLTPREQQVLEGLVAGLPLKKIASTMGRSVKTVTTYRSRILAKLGCHSNADLFRYSRDTAMLKSPASRETAR